MTDHNAQYSTVGALTLMPLHAKTDYMCIRKPERSLQVSIDVTSLTGKFEQWHKRDSEISDYESFASFLKRRSAHASLYGTSESERKIGLQCSTMLGNPEPSFVTSHLYYPTRPIEDELTRNSIFLFCNLWDDLEKIVGEIVLPLNKEAKAFYQIGTTLLHERKKEIEKKRKVSAYPSLTLV